MRQRIQLKVLRTILLLFALVCLASCGWRVRGNVELPEGLNSVSIQGPSVNDPMTIELNRLLSANGIHLAVDGEAPQLVLVLGELEETRRVAATGANTLVNQYELTSQMSFAVADGQGNELLGEEILTSNRSYQFDQNDVVGAGQEERLLQREMRRDLTQQVVRRLRFVDTSNIPE